ncbi:MAG: hypothetical protein ACM3S1_08240 [Hyphomicrobiales bacterium]
MKGADSGYYYPLPFVGQYRDNAGTVDAVGGNPFAAELDGLTVADATARMPAAVAK